jgi:predicted RNA methylase
MRLQVWLGAVLALAAAGQNPRIEVLAPYTPTPDVVVDRMLKLGDLKAGEKMFDLGSGDGRIVILAAKKYGADATGVEYDDGLYKSSSKRIEKMGLASKARIIHGDLLKQDYSSADLIAVYLLSVGNIRLKPILEQQLKKGARVVSHNVEFPGWTPEKVETIENDGQGESHRIYLYRR